MDDRTAGAGVVRENFRAEVANFSLNGGEHLGWIAAGAGIEIHGVGIALFERQIDAWLRRLGESGVVGGAGDADDLPHGFFSGNADAFAEGALIRPEIVG